jgi:archaetidylinositol phosphate synthase
LSPRIASEAGGAPPNLSETREAMEETLEVRPISEHVREHRSILAVAEKRILIRIAERLPRWILSDHLTLLGFISMCSAGLLFWAAGTNKWFLPGVVIALVLNWFGDSLDGTLARIRNRQRPRYGFYVDHVLDVLGISFMLCGLALSGYMSPLVALGLLIAYLVVTAEVFLATCVHGVFRMSSLGMGPTELRIVLAVGTLYLMHSPWARIFGMGPFLLFNIGGLVAIAGLAVAFLLSAIRNTCYLYRAEPLNR